MDQINVAFMIGPISEPDNITVRDLSKSMTQQVLQLPCSMEQQLERMIECEGVQKLRMSLACDVAMVTSNDAVMCNDECIQPLNSSTCKISSKQSICQGRENTSFPNLKSGLECHPTIAEPFAQARKGLFGCVNAELLCQVLVIAVTHHDPKVAGLCPNWKCGNRTIFSGNANVITISAMANHLVANLSAVGAPNLKQND